MGYAALTKPSRLRCALGTLAALVLFEFGLRPFVAGGNRATTGVRTIRSYGEGFANAHFDPDGLGTYGNRLTGNPVQAGAPQGVILGDSHVIAEAVGDEETMGAVIERLSRQSGRPLNMRQYGWSSANAATFLAVAEPVLKACHPAWVAVVLNRFNIGVQALTTMQNWRMEVGPGDSLRLIDMRPPSPTHWQLARRELARSSLALGMWRRVNEIQNESGKDGFGGTRQTIDAKLEAESERVPQAALLGLKERYGSRLLVVYTPAFFGTHYDSADPVEQELLGLCAENAVACFSVREALAAERYEKFRLSRGSHNTAPGAGHFNATGHRIIGQEIWRYVSTHAWPN